MLKIQAPHEPIFLDDAEIKVWREKADSIKQAIVTASLCVAHTELNTALGNLYMQYACSILEEANVPQ